MSDVVETKAGRGGYRANSGRKPAHPTLKKIPFNTKIPQWLKDWLVAEERDESAPVLIERALRHRYKLKPPKGNHD